MWNVEKDPWLNPSGGSLSIIDGEVDPDELDRWLRAAVAALPRLRERVVPGIGRFERPSWRADPEFDFGHHVRHVELAGAGDERELLDYVALAHQEPYDRTRPLWQITLIGGVDGDRSALLMKLHHSIADGYGMARMQERFMVREADAPVPDEVDLDALVAETCAREAAEDPEPSATSRALDVATAPAELSRRMAGRAAIATADPSVWLDAASSARRYARMISSQVRSESSGTSGGGGSPLWTERSRHRHLEIVRVPLDRLKAAGKALGGSVNDVFMAALIDAAVAHHDTRGVPAESFNTSFVISTRSDSAEGGNSFTPVRVSMPATPMTPAERVTSVQERVRHLRSRMVGGGLMGDLAGVVNLLPTSVTTSTARAQAARLDFATTNVRSTSRQLYICGRKMTEIFAPGPVAGSAMIVAAISYNGTMHLMLTIDPAAITEPAALRDDIDEAFAAILATG